MLQKLYQEDEDEFEGGDYDPEGREYELLERSVEKSKEWKEKVLPITEDAWIKKQESFPFFDETLKHSFGKTVAVFGITYNENTNETEISFQNIDQSDHYASVLYNDYLINGDVESAKKIVNGAVEHFAKEKYVNVEEIDEYLEGVKKQLQINPSEPIQTNTTGQPPISDKSIENKNVIENKFYWEDLRCLDLAGTLAEELQEEGCEFLITDFNMKQLENNPYYFLVQPSNNNNNIVLFYNDLSDIMDSKPILEFPFKGNMETTKKTIEKTIEHFSNAINKNIKYDDIEKYIRQQMPVQKISSEQPSDTFRYLDIAQKTGYVQGVCESVLAFNTEENRKIMSEATMSFLSKKLLTEMNVTKDMAQKFANPETYKALEKCLFVPAQEQQLEQTQTQGRRI